MKKTQTNFEKLRRFFINAFSNAEVSRTEVENFLQDYLSYIFELNHLNVNNYQISISKVSVDEKHAKRERKYNRVADREKRNTIKNKIMYKTSFEANCGNHYFDAVMIPHPSVANKYNIVINKNLCQAHNDEEIMSLAYLFNVFGHEVHHIIQYIKRPKEMDRYDYLQELHSEYLKNADSILDNPREVRKLKRAINQHMSLLYSNCNSEIYADKKGYDYLDILFNEILDSLPPVNSIEEDMFKTFIESLQKTNELNFSERDHYMYMCELKNGDCINRLINLPVDADLLEIN